MSTLTIYASPNGYLGCNVTELRSQSQTLHVTLSSRKDEVACTDPPAQVRTNIYIGSNASLHLSTLQRLGITHVLVAACELAPVFPDHQFVYHQLSLSDTDDDDLISLFPKAFEFIEAGRKAGRVLVHCAQGVSRSASILTGYLMWKERLSFATALAHLQEARPSVQPNQGFSLQLQQFEAAGSSTAPGSWGGWGKQQLESSLAEASVSGRRAVHDMADLIRRFHLAADEDDSSTVFWDCNVML